mgnify:CR=1 FL=1
MTMTNIRLSPQKNQSENSWQFSEVWIDPMLTPPYVLLLLADAENKCYVYDPAKDYFLLMITKRQNYGY